MKTRVRVLVFAFISSLLLSALAFAVAGQRTREKEPDAEGQWEYLIVSGGNVNLSSVGDISGARKQPDTSFSREFVPLERNFDKLGAKGWELISVHGNLNDPVYFFKRRRETR